MKQIELKHMGLAELNFDEAHETNGGIIGLLVAYALQTAVVGSLAAGLYGAFKAGYNDVQ